VSLIRRVAFLSLHTSPMEQPGSGDAGGMNVYVRALAAALAETGVEVEIFTRSTSATQPAVEHPSPGVCVHNVLAGPPRKLPKEELPGLLHSMVAEIDRIRQLQPHGRYDVIHSHYWVSGVAGLELAELWRLPLVHTMHTMAKVKNQLLESGEQPEPRRREDGEHRIVDGAARLIANTGTEAAELVSHYNADIDRIDVAPPGCGPGNLHARLQEPRHGPGTASPGQVPSAVRGPDPAAQGPADPDQSGGAPALPAPGHRPAADHPGAVSGAKDFNLKTLISAAGMDDVVTHHPPVNAPELAGWYRSPTS
jgi:D-inositol-3-phosphate glycosyltransferase